MNKKASKRSKRNKRLKRRERNLIKEGVIQIARPPLIIIDDPMKEVSHES